MHIFDEKFTAPQVGAHFVYTEGLYMNFEETAFDTKNKFAQRMVNHMGGLRKLVAKNFIDYQIPKAFSFEAWFQMYLSHPDFLSVIAQAHTLYKHDTKFQQYIAQDTQDMERELTPQQVSFLIEEHVFSYLALNRQLDIRNEHVGGREEWILLCYPGKPLVSEIYFYQKDILSINKDTNQFKGHFDVTSRIFYDFDALDLSRDTL